MKWWLLFFSCFWIQTAYSMNYGMDCGFFPFEHISAMNKAEGYNLELVEAISAATQSDIRIEKGCWAGAVEKYNRGEIDMISAGIDADGVYNTAIKAPSYALSHLTIANAVFVRKEDRPIGNIKELNGLRLGVSDLSYTEQAIRRSGIEAELVRAFNEHEAIQLLLNDEVDAVVVNSMLGRNFIEENRIHNIVESPLSLFPRSYAFFIHESNTALIETMINGFKLVTQSGELSRIKDRWFSTYHRVNKMHTYGYWFMLMFVAMLLVSFVLILVSSLQRLKLQLADEQVKNQELLATKQAKFATLGMLASGVSHEINNPNAVVLHTAKLLQRRLLQGDIDLSDRYLEDKITVIAGAASRISNIVRELKDYSRQRDESDALPSCSLHSAVSASLLMLKHALNQKHYRIDLQQAHDAQVLFDKEKLEQVIINLLTNAIKASGEHSCISVRYGDSDGGPYLHVIDQGIGMSEAEIKHCFEPFYTRFNDNQSTGMGLAICQRICSDFHTEIEISSELAKGTRVSLRFASTSDTIAS